MKLSEDGKWKDLARLWDITEACYTGVELPTREMFERIVKGGDVFIPDWAIGEEAVGYALVTPDTSPLLVSLAVMPGSRGYGIGKELLQEIAAYYHSLGAREIVLHCKTDNPAQTLYFKEGYRVTAYLRNYYKPEGDGLEMRKVLGMQVAPSKSDLPHRHCTVKIRVPVSRLTGGFPTIHERLALQAMLGSDRRCELLRYMRWTFGDPHPILFLEKK